MSKAASCEPLPRFSRHKAHELFRMSMGPMIGIAAHVSNARIATLMGRFLLDRKRLLHSKGDDHNDARMGHRIHA
jgi:hypothetical protein